MPRNLTVHEVAERMDRPVREVVKRLRGVGILVERGADELEPEEIQAMLVGKPPTRWPHGVGSDHPMQVESAPSVFDTTPSVASHDLVALTDRDRELIQFLRTAAGQATAQINSRVSSQLVGAIVPSLDEVFVVHGHDDVRHKVEEYLRSLALHPVLLDSRPNRGRTIIEKLEAHANTSFAVVLLTPDDQGRKCGRSRLQYRARQNVVLELGFFLAKLGRERVCALYTPGVELPSDFHGVLYVELDSDDGWRKQLHRELVAANLPVMSEPLPT